MNNSEIAEKVNAALREEFELEPELSLIHI